MGQNTSMGLSVQGLLAPSSAPHTPSFLHRQACGERRRGRRAGLGLGPHTHGGGSPRAEGPGTAPATAPAPATAAPARPSPGPCSPAPTVPAQSPAPVRAVPPGPGLGSAPRVPAPRHGTDGVRGKPSKGCLHYTACLPTVSAYSAALA